MLRERSEAKQKSPPYISLLTCFLNLVEFGQVRTVDVYDPTSDSWSSIASMEARRRSQTFIRNPCKVFEIQRICGFIALS